ncbi:hypothetical protein [Rhodopseudomonas parapalustris]
MGESGISASLVELTPNYTALMKIAYVRRSKRRDRSAMVKRRWTALCRSQSDAETAVEIDETETDLLGAFAVLFRFRSTFGGAFDLIDRRRRQRLDLFGELAGEDGLDVAMSGHFEPPWLEVRPTQPAD